MWDLSLSGQPLSLTITCRHCQSRIVLITGPGQSSLVNLPGLLELHSNYHTKRGLLSETTANILHVSYSIT